MFLVARAFVWYIAQAFPMYGLGDIVDFVLITPITPGAPLDSPAFLPHTSTPLSHSCPKLNQRAAQIRGPFWASSSRLGVSAPAPLGAFLVLRAPAAGMLFCPSRYWFYIEGSIALRF